MKLIFYVNYFYYFNNILIQFILNKYFYVKILNFFIFFYKFFDFYKKFFD